MNQPPAHNLSPQEMSAKKKMLRTIIYFAAVVMFAIGVLCFVQPDIVRTVINLDDMTLKIFGGLVIAVSVFDVIFFGRMLKEQEPK